MDKSGFTLIELIGSIVILAIIALIAFPSVVSVFNKENIKINDSAKETLKLAALDYVNDRVDEYPKSSLGDGKYIDFCTLYNDGYTNIDFSDKQYSGISNSRILITSNGEKYIAEFKDSGASVKCS